jgi:hypothetical protein
VKERKIEVFLTPHYHDNKENPYFWCILEWNNSWANVGWGWAETPLEAFNMAYEENSNKEKSKCIKL